MKTFALISALILWQPAIGAELVQGTVFGWGDNISGQATGIPVKLNANAIPIGSVYSTGCVYVVGNRITNAVAIAAGTAHGLALLADSTVVGWGDNMQGEATGHRSPYPGRGSGRVEINGQVLSNIVAVAAGNRFSLALRSNGTVVAWGGNAAPSALSNVVAIAARGVYSLALRSDGAVCEWGSAPWASPHAPLSLSNMVALATGGVMSGTYERSMAIRSDGSVVVWGNGIPDFELAPPDSFGAVGIAAGGSFSLALKADGTVFGWGFNADGEAVGRPTPNGPHLENRASGSVHISGSLLRHVVAISAGDAYGLAIKDDGTVAAWGDRRFYRDIPGELSGVVSISAGPDFCLAIITNAPPFGR